MTDKVIKITSGTTWLVPSDFSAVNSLVCIGPGSAGGTGIANCYVVTPGYGGGGGAWAVKNNLSNFGTPGSTSLTIQIGAQNSGTATLIKDASATTVCSAAAATANMPNGGVAASCIGDTKYKGGYGGGNGASSGGGGGGAGGPHGAGADGGNSNGGFSPGANGGQGDNGSGGAGGAGGTYAGGAAGAGSPGAEYTITAGGSAGSGGGAGAAAGGTANGGVGGSYGGGGGGGTSITYGGAAAPGVIIITYTPAGKAHSFGAIFG